jgi:cell division protein FtsB
MGKLIRFRKKGKAVDQAERALFPPFQSGSTDARHAAYQSDASPSSGVERPGVAPDPVIERKNIRKRRGAIFMFMIVFAGGTAAALFGDRGYLDVQRQQAQLQQLLDESEAHQQRVDALSREIQRLRADPSAVERIARENLGYVAPGEITLLLPEDPAEKPPRLDVKNGSGIVPAARKTP